MKMRIVDIANLADVTEGAVRNLRSRGELPLPDGRDSMGLWWESDKISDWDARRSRQSRAWSLALLSRSHSITARQARLFAPRTGRWNKIEIIQRQDGKCAICSTPISEVWGDADHNHRCELHAPNKQCYCCERAILCPPCNKGLGLLKDDPALLKRAADYLTQWQETKAARMSDYERR